MTEPTTLPPITVIGQRPIFGTLMVPISRGEGGVHQQEVTMEDGTSGGGGWAVATPEEVEAEEKRQKDCAAKKYNDRLQSKGDKNSKEYFSLTFVRNGEIVTTDLRGGAAAIITGVEIQAAMTEFGITASDLIAYNHNHPSSIYCNSSDGYTRYLQDTTNAYPSDNDWNAATLLLNPSLNPDFSMYVSGCNGALREFSYSGREAFRQSRNATATPPPAVQPEGCPED
jgi:hypothetical protein